MVAEVWSPLLLLPLRDGASEDLFSGDFRRLVFCFLHVVSGVHDGGGRSLAEVDGRLEHEGVLCGRFSTDVIFGYALLCIGVQINRGLLCAGCFLAVRDVVDFAITGMASGGWRNVLSLRSGSDDNDAVCDYFERLVYQPRLKSGWVFNPTFSGGLLSHWDVLLSGEMEVSSNLEAPGLCSSGEMMVVGHPQRPGRSAVLRYADEFDILLSVPPKNFDVPLERGSASSCRRLLRSPATGTTGLFLQGPGCNFILFQGRLCKI